MSVTMNTVKNSRCNGSLHVGSTKSSSSLSQRVTRRKSSSSRFSKGRMVQKSGTSKPKATVDSITASNIDTYGKADYAMVGQSNFEKVRDNSRNYSIDAVGLKNSVKKGRKTFLNGLWYASSK